MGCGNSRAKQLKEWDLSIADAEASLGSPDLSSLSRAATLLTDTMNAVVADGAKEGDLIARMQSAGDTLVEKLCGMIDTKTVEDAPKIGEIRGIATQLDSVCVKPATPLIDEKLSTLNAELAATHLQMLQRTIQQIRSFEQLRANSAKAVELIRKIERLIKGQQKMVHAVLEQGTQLALRILNYSTELLSSSNHGDFAHVLASATTMDQLCSFIANTLPKTTWDPVAPKMQEMQDDVGLRLTKSSLETCSSELAKAEGMNSGAVAKALKKIGNNGPQYGSRIENFNSRMDSIMETLANRITSSFEKAVASGSEKKMEALVTFAETCDETVALLAKRKWDKESKDGLAAKLKGKQASVTTGSILENALKSLEETTGNLHDMREEAHGKVQHMPKESFVSSEGVQWKFKLRSGAFKEYTEDKSNEVEALYQKWVGNGKPKDQKNRRYEIKIPVPAGKGGKVLPGGGKARQRCKHGESCYRKNLDHRREFSHPGDPDWDTSGDADVVVSCGETDEDRYSLDFLLMTQVNLSRRAGMRNINRVEKPPAAVQACQSYFDKVKGFVTGMEDLLSKTEYNISWLPTGEREPMQEKINAIVAQMQPAIVEFLSLAVTVRARLVIDETVALLGKHAEILGVNEQLKELRLTNTLDELRMALQPLPQAQGRRGVRGWRLLKALAQQHLLIAKVKVPQIRQEAKQLQMRHVQMQCQALLSEYAEDDSLVSRFRERASAILKAAADESISRRDPSDLQALLKMAIVFQVNTKPMLEAARPVLTGSLIEACASRIAPSRALERINELFGLIRDVASAGKASDSRVVCDWSAVAENLGKFAVKMVPRDGSDVSGSVKTVAKLRGKCNYAEDKAHFDGCFFIGLQQIYESDGQDKLPLVEWTAAFCEQIGEAMPPWMLTSDKLEALKQLESAMEGDDDQELQAAVKFAKQADLKSEADLLAMYNKALAKLKQLKRLPPGWEIEDMLGDDEGVKMFQMLDAGDTGLKLLCQQLLDETKSSIVTRDRTEKIARTFTVERVVQVMNAESWGSYLKRRDAIEVECRKHGRPAWDGMSGPIICESGGKRIMKHCKIPELADKANEYLMFHGTKPDAADAIAKNHFDMAFACKGGLFGAGLYFAESVTKADEYVKPSSEGHYPLLLVRVTLGHMNYIPNSEPWNDPGRAAMESSCITGGYHSVLGDRKKARGTYREFIVYDHYQAYPHFIVWYSKSG